MYALLFIRVCITIYLFDLVLSLPSDKPEILNEILKFVIKSVFKPLYIVIFGIIWLIRPLIYPPCIYVFLARGKEMCFKLVICSNLNTFVFPFTLAMFVKTDVEMVTTALHLSYHFHLVTIAVCILILITVVHTIFG